MLKVKEAVIVEGKYDKIKLSNLLDALIIETNGFSVYKDKKKLAFIKKLANERGIDMKTAPLSVLDSLWDEVKLSKNY